MKILSEKLLKKYDRKEALHITKIMTGRQSDMIEPSRPADYAEAKLKTAVKCLMYFLLMMVGIGTMLFIIGKSTRG